MQCDRIFFCWNFMTIFVIFMCQTGLSKNLTIPPFEFPRNNSSYKIVFSSPENSDTPPHVFPNNDSQYKIVHNITILKDLRLHSENKDQSKIDTEVSDLAKPALEHEQSVQNISTIEQQKTTTAISQKSNNEKITTEKDLELDQEEIESDVSKTEDVKINKSVPAVSRSEIHQGHDHNVRGSGPVVQGQLAAVLAGVFALIAVVSYVVLLTWRRYLEHRYGNREMLINEEDHVNYNDMKNFEL